MEIEKGLVLEDIQSEFGGGGGWIRVKSFQMGELVGEVLLLQIVEHEFKF